MNDRVCGAKSRDSFESCDKVLERMRMGVCVCDLILVSSV